jgi:hypothetical protein
MGRNGALLNQVHDFICVSSISCVGHSPRRLFLNNVVGSLVQLDELGDEAGIDDSLDLVSRPACDVGHSPRSLLSNALLGVIEQLKKHMQHVQFEDSLRLCIVASDKVAD